MDERPGNGVAQARVLVVDDDRAAADAAAEILREAGHQVRVLYDGRRAVEYAKGWKADVVVLDLLMPFVDGLSVCVALREQASCCVLFLSAKGEPTDRAVGLRVGADDYLPKPYDATELEARVAALVRRRQRLEETPRELRLGSVVVDRRSKRATVEGRDVDLTPTELRLLEVLGDECGRVFTRAELLRDVWDGRVKEPTRAVDVHLGRLRRKLDKAGASGIRLEARRGFGYVATLEASSRPELAVA